MRRGAVALLLVAIVAVTVGLGFTAGVSAGALVIGVLVVLRLLGHVWFVTAGPNASLRSHEQKQNRRRVHRELRSSRVR